MSIVLDETVTSWWDRAACRSGDGSLASLFFPTTADGETRADQEAAAKAICAGCPCRTRCLEDAVARREPAGVWGGLNFSRKHERTLARGMASGAAAA